MFAGVRAPLFLLTALLWLIASVLLGLYLWIAKEIGLPSVPHLRVIHAHSALVGGVAQMIFGGLLTFLPPLLMVPDPKKSRIFQYLLLNAGAAGMMIGFGTGNLPVVGFSGMAVGLAFLSLIIEKPLAAGSASLVLRTRRRCSSGRHRSRRDGRVRIVRP